MARMMQEKFGDQLDLQIHRTDSEEAKAYTLRSSTTVLVNQEMVPLDVATSGEKMAAYLEEILLA